MKRHLRSLIAIAAAVLIPAAASTATPEDAGTKAQSGSRQFTAEGTLATGQPVSITIVAAPSEESRAKAALSNAMSRAQQFYGEFFNPGGVASQMGKLDKGQSLELSATAFEFMRKARILAPQTDGFFDITGPSPRHSFMKSDWRRVKLNTTDNSVSFKSDDIKLDLKRIALGYTCDLMIEAIQGEGFQNASVAAGPVTRNVGRDIYTPWDIMVGFGETTTTGTHRAYRYGVSNVGAATVTPGDLGAGLIDPLNKKQVDWDGEIRSVTIIATDATTATGFALATYTVGPKYAMKYMTGHPAVKGIIVDGQGNLYTSKDLGMKSTPYEKSQVVSNDGGPDDIRLKQKEEKSR